LVEKHDHENDHREDENHSEHALTNLFAGLVDGFFGLVGEAIAIRGVGLLDRLDDERCSIRILSSILLLFLLFLLGLGKRRVIFDWCTTGVRHLGDFSTEVQRS
jgi:hypothetical protein